ncbi:hypothetical protein [Methylobacterium haplocladii]|uniref:hypothetical protein n=1 Tax=Methylobacterium haplocladii TaxID=1176176 RepID=UPI001478CF4D|nr:hypothetical protein [Methylobacterium haplocladii]
MRTAFPASAIPMPPGLDRPFAGKTGVIADRLVAAEGNAVPAGVLAETAFGADNLRCRQSLRGAVQTLRKALARTGSDDRIIETGRGPTLTYAWVRSTPKPEIEPVAPPAAMPVHASNPRAITLAPCGYAAWSYVPGTNIRGPVQVIRRHGEDEERRLTQLDIANGRPTTEHARFATEDDDGGEA